MLGFSRLRGRALRAFLLLLPWLVLGTAASHSVVAAEDTPSEAGELLGAWNDLFHGITYFSPDNDTGDHSMVTPFTTVLDEASGVLRWAEHSVSEKADMRYAAEFPLAGVRATLETEEFCDGCRTVPQGIALHSIFIQCVGGKECVQYFVHRREQADWGLERSDGYDHYRIDCPSDRCGALDEKLQALIKLYRGKRSGG